MHAISCSQKTHKRGPNRCIHVNYQSFSLHNNFMQLLIVKQNFCTRIAQWKKIATSNYSLSDSTKPWWMGKTISWKHRHSTKNETMNGRRVHVSQKLTHVPRIMPVMKAIKNGAHEFFPSANWPAASKIDEVMLRLPIIFPFFRASSISKYLTAQ